MKKHPSDTAFYEKVNNDEEYKKRIEEAHYYYHQKDYPMSDEAMEMAISRAYEIIRE